MYKSDSSSDASEAESTYAKAAKAELARDFDSAFRLYVKAAELYIHLGRSNKHHDKDEARWKASAGKALQRAEKIKDFVNRSAGSSKVGDPRPGCSVAPTSNPELILTPIGIDHFSKQEQFYVLDKGGSVNGITFPLWDDPPALPYDLSPSSLYQDLDGQPKLSPEQAKVSPIWRRLRICDSNADTIHDSTRHKIMPQAILQHIVTDCSVCASISVCLEHARRFGTNLAESAVYDLCDRFQMRQESRVVMTSGAPNATGSFGGYDVKIFFNGAWRRIVIDDKLPYHPDGSLMCMSVLSQNDEGCFQPQNIWPSILEKGYMKLMGGYDFPGSNSSIDLHALAGWIPEHIELKGSSFEREKTWERVLEGFQNGLCVLTLGTGTSPNIQWQGNDLLPSHSYAVIDVRESEGARTFTVLDTWVNPDHENQSRELSRTLEVSWSDVLNVFDGIYLSWDPDRWARSLVFHGMWRRKHDEQSSSRQVSLKFNDTYENSDEEIWVLLTRHVIDSSRTTDFISLKIEVDDDLRNSSSAVGHAAIIAKGTYTNSTHVLVRTRIPSSQRSGALTIVTSYDGEATEVGYTLTAYVGAGFTIAWDEDVRTPPFTQRIEGVLTSKNAGGNCTYPTFMLNPQYYLRIHPPKVAGPGGSKPKVALILETSRDTPVNAVIVWSEGERINELVEKDLTASSGAYNYGLARVTKEVRAGDYTVVISAFEPHHTGPFSLQVECSQPFDLKSIPQEGAGMYSKVIRGAWDLRTAGGGPTSNRYSKNPVFEIAVPRLTQLKARLQLLRPLTATALNLTIFPASSDGSLGRHITTSGAYNDSISGVATPQISLNAGKYWAVPSTYNPGVEAGFQLILYTSIVDVRITSTRDG